MEAKSPLTGRLVAAARALTGVSRSDFADAAGISPERFQLLETSGSSWIPEDESQSLHRVLEMYGAVIIPEENGMGAGVRLKFTRNDVRQITRLENEGGVTRPDDVP
jgi:hypothetical protein